jgi:prepilin-type N-terminal cleavage/methylation domain-containing protein
MKKEISDFGQQISDLRLRNVQPETWRTRLDAKNGGFTLVELLAAMTILVIITLIVSKMFQQASVSWDTGTRKAETNMKGRAVVDFIARELSEAILTPPYYPDFNVSGSIAEFWMLGTADSVRRAPMRVKYSQANRHVSFFPALNGGATPPPEDGLLSSGIKDVLFFAPSPASAGMLPPYATVEVTVTDDKGIDHKFQSTAFFKNRDRAAY